MFGIVRNPSQVREGDKLATKTHHNSDGTITVFKTRVVKKVEFCPGKVECFHIDHECYDTRFSTVVVASG